MYKLHSIAAALFLMVVTPKARAWEIGSMSTTAANPTARSILKVHNELRDGVPSYIAYFVSTNEAIVLSSPDTPGMQFLRKILDDAYLNGKKLCEPISGPMPTMPRCRSNS